MNLWQEADRITLLGVEMYGFGLYVAIGAIFAAVTMGVLSWAREMKKGTAPLLMCFSIVLGIVCSRLVFLVKNEKALVPDRGIKVFWHAQLRSSATHAV